MRRMEVRISGRGTRITDKVRAHAIERVGRSSKFFDRLGDVFVTISSVNHPDQGHDFKTELSARAAGQIIRATGMGDTATRSIDAASDHFDRRLRRLSQKLTDRRRHGPRLPHGPGPTVPSVGQPSGGPEPITRVRRAVGKPCTAEEAAIRLEELGESFLFFTDVETGRINVLHRDEDGHLVVLEPD